MPQLSHVAGRALAVFCHCPTQMLTADYLVVGAGLHSLAFVDELLAQDQSATFIIVDSHAAPGGHWNDACSARPLELLGHRS